MNLIRSVVEGLELRLLYTTVIGQTITAPTTWSAANSPYNLSGAVIVGAGGSLTIQSGVTVNGAQLTVASGGAINATGATVTNPFLVQAGGTGSIATTVFSSTSEFDTAAVAISGDTFGDTLTAVPTFITSLAANGNNLSTGTVVNLEGATVTTPLTLPIISGIATYNLSANLNIASGGVLTVAAGVTLAGSPLVIQSGGTLTAGTVIFDNDVQAQSGSSGTITGSTLVSTIESDTGSLTLTADTFESTVTILPTFAPTLAAGGNTFTGAVPIDLIGATLNSALTLPLIAGDPGYDLTGGLTVGSGGALTINTVMTISGSTLTIASGGSITATGVTFDNAVLVQTGATGSITTCTISGTLELDTAALTITGNTYRSVVSILPTYITTLAGSGGTFTGSDIGLLGSTLTTTLTLPLFTNVPAFSLVGDVYIGTGGALTIANGVTLTGDALVVGSGGSLTAAAVTFDNPVDVQSGSTGNISSSTFASSAEFDLTSLIIDVDTFDSTVSVLPTYVASLASNSNIFSGDVPVNILGSTINSAITLPVITGVPYYDLAGFVYVSSVGSLTLNIGVTLAGSMLTVQSGGTLTATGDTFDSPVDVQSGSLGNVSTCTFANASEFDVSSLIISNDIFDATVSVFPNYAPNLGINSNTFPGSPTINLLGSTTTTTVDLPAITGVSQYILASNVNVGAGGDIMLDSGVTLAGSTLTVESGGELVAVADTINTPLSLASGSTAVLEYNYFAAPLNINGQIVGSSAINHNDFSSPLTSVIATGAGGPINLTQNWWGTTSVTQIGYKIEDQNDNPALPLVNFEPVLTSAVVIPTLLATISAPPVTLGSTAEVIAVSYSDATAAISLSTINSENLTVLTAAGQSLTLIETGYTVEGNKTVVDYAVTPPNGIHWLPVNDGTGSVNVNLSAPVTDVDGNVAFSPSIAFVVDVPGNTASTAALTASPSAANVGDVVTLTATVAPAVSSSIVPTGFVNFVLNGVTVGSATLNTAGQAVLATDALPAGSDSIIAEYTGDNNYAESNSPAFVVTETVRLISSTTSVSVSAITLAAGSAITLSATVVPGVGGVATPTGTVSFSQNGTVIGTAALQPSGQATLATSLEPGVDPIIATYSGDGTYATSASLPVTVTATSGSSTTLTVSPSLIFAGDDVTLTATVVPSIPDGVVLAGTVEFLEAGGSQLGTATIGTNGQAVLQTTSIPQGTNMLTAVYAGQGVYSGSTSQVVTQPVSPPPNSAILITVSAPAIPELGDAVSYNATVESLIGGAVPTGQVTFSLAGTVLGRVTLTNGTALFTTTALVVGNNTVTVNYGGDSTYTQARPVTNSIYIYEDGPVPTAGTGTLSTQIAGTISPGVMEVTVSNPTLQSVIGQGTINIFATQTGVVDANSSLVQSTYVNYKMKPGATQTFKIIVKPLPYNLLSGTYTLLAASSTQFGLFNYATTGPTVAVIAQNRTFTGTVTMLRLPTPGTAIAGNTTGATAELTLTNTGNVSLIGRTTFKVSASTTSGVVGTQIVTYTLNQNLKPGKTATIRLPLRSFPIVAGGNYYFVVQMTDPVADTFIFSPATTFPITARIVSLSAVFGSGTFTSPAGLFITVTNNGNVSEVSALTAVAGYSLDAAGAQPLAGRTATVITPRLVLKPGRSVRIHLNAWSTLSPNLSTGTLYYATLTLTDSAGNSTFAVDPDFQFAG